MLASWAMRFETIGPITPGEFLGELTRLKARLGSSVSLGVVYFPVQMNPAVLHSAWRSTFEVPLIGSSTAGAAFTERGSTHNGIVAGVFAATEVDISVAENLRHTGIESLNDAISTALETGSRHNGVLVLTDPFACDGETVFTALRTTLPAHTRAFGCCAGDDDQFQGVKLLVDGQVRSDVAIIAALTFPTQVGIYVRHGFTRADQAKEMVVTLANGSLLIQLDGRPAAEVYEEELERLDLLRRGETLLKTFAKHSLSIRTPFGEGLLVRTPIGLKPNGSIQLTTGVPVGQRVSVVTTTGERLIEAARWLRSQVQSYAPNPEGILVFDCGGRRAILGDDYEKSVSALSGGNRSVPLLGIAGYGEIAKFGGSVQGFHNITAVMVGW